MDGSDLPFQLESPVRPTERYDRGIWQVSTHGPVVLVYENEKPVHRCVMCRSFDVPVLNKIDGCIFGAE